MLSWRKISFDMTGIYRYNEESGLFTPIAVPPTFLSREIATGRLPGFFTKEHLIEDVDEVYLREVGNVGAVPSIVRKIYKNVPCNIASRNEGGLSIISVEWDGKYIGDVWDSMYADEHLDSNISRFFFYWLGLSDEALFMYLRYVLAHGGYVGQNVFAVWDEGVVW